MQVVPVVQSILCVEQQKLCGIELLCRLQEREGLLSPYGRVKPKEWAIIDLLMINQVLPVAQQLLSHAPKLFLNVSAASLDNDQDFDRWQSALALLIQHLDAPVVLEISEQIDTTLLKRRWPELMQLNGVELAIDDFGDENSSFCRLLDYQWHYCKFDARMITKIPHIMALRMCEHNNTDVIVERVETTAISQQCQDLGISNQQGFLFSYPLPVQHWIEETTSIGS